MSRCQPQLIAVSYSFRKICKSLHKLRQFAEMSVRVQLAVYDLSRGMAMAMSQQILGQRIDGIWHTGIVVFDYEYYFGGGIQVSPWGVFAMQNGMQPSQLLDMGMTTKSKEELENYLRTIQSRFTAMTYDLINNNCNNFSDVVCNFLTGHGIPTHIVDLPRIVFSTPGGAMLRPMIEGMQNNIRQQHSHTLDPFGNTSQPNGQRFEADLSNAVRGVVMNTMQQQQAQAVAAPPAKAKLDELPLLSQDAGTLTTMEKMLHNLVGTDGEKGSALSEAEHETLRQIVRKLQMSIAMGKNEASNESKPSAAERTSSDPFAVEEYMLLEKLLAEQPKAHSAALFILRLMFLHDRVSDYSSIGIVKRLTSRLLSRGDLQRFSSVPSHVMALCAISNLLSHEKGLSALYMPAGSESSATATVDDAVINDLVDVVLTGLGHERAEVRQMSTALAYNLTLACTKDFRPSGPWSGGNADELNPHAMRLLCSCLEGVSTEKDAVVRKRRLAIACRIGRTFGNAASSLMNDLGFSDGLQVLKSDADIKPEVSTDEKAMIGELLHYCL